MKTPVSDERIKQTAGGGAEVLYVGVDADKATK
jgi:hypothetical protein